MSNSSAYIGVIPAKGGSSRLPNKNMADLNGRPMLDYTVQAARESHRLSAVYVSTDSDAVEAHVRALGLPTIRRGADLAGDAPIIAVYRHAWEKLGRPTVRAIVGLQPDHPDRTVSIDEAIAAFEEVGADMLVSTEANGAKKAPITSSRWRCWKARNR
jgi:CMP-N-acetylneuraminic acid synthetase